MILMPDLFSFAYVPNWYSQLDMLAEMALPEPWRFKNPIYLTKNPDTPILERYIHAIFKKQLIDYKEERISSNAAKFFHIENEFCCFHTGLYTRRYKAIYACFDRNKKKDSLLEWYFRGFADELSPMLRHISPLPKKPSYYMTQYGVNYNPEWPIRVNVDHILGDEENLSRIPAEIREAQNLPLLLETAVELARRKAVVEPSIVVPQGYQGRVQYLLPICLTDMEQPDLAMTLTIMDGYYLGNTCLTLEMGYTMDGFRKAVKAAMGGSVAGGGSTSGSGSSGTSGFPAVPFTVKVLIPDLNYRSAPSMSGSVKGQTGKGIFTIVEVKNGWGRLKSGAGWIYLENPSYCTVQSSGSGGSSSSGSFLVQVSATDLNIRKGPGTNYGTTGKYTEKGTFTIVETRSGQGSKAGWGKLKSGAGWISLDYCKRV